MVFEPKETLKEFTRYMHDVEKTIPEEYGAFINEKSVVTATHRIPEKTKWLLLLVASLSHECEICIARAVQHCLEVGWTKAEILEACMVAVLVGGSSVMTYVTIVAKTIDELQKA